MEGKIQIGKLSYMKEELDKLADVLDDAVLRAENLMNQFEPGSGNYNTFSQWVKTFKEILKELKK